MIERVRQSGSLLCLGAILGLGFGWMLWRPKPMPAEPAAPEVRQADGSVQLQRAPDAQAKPAHMVPRDAVVERVVAVTVQPRASLSEIPIHGSGPANEISAPSPVRLDLTLIRQGDGTRRVIASSPDGDIVGGVDIPVESARPQRAMPWAAGGLWDPSERTAGAWVHRALGPAVLGVQVQQQRLPIQAGGGTTIRGSIMLGIRW